MGILTFLRNTLGIPPPTPPPNKQRPKRGTPHVEIYGPRGIRRMLRMLWHTTHTRSEHAYAVHELLFPGEVASIGADVRADATGAADIDVRHDSECIGRDIWCDAQGFWRGIVDASSGNHGRTHGGAVVDAGPIQHRDPCIGYVIREMPELSFRPHLVPRKLVILGDTCDPSRIAPLIHDDPPFASEILDEVDPCGTGESVRVPVSLLVHEATDAYLPPGVDPQGRTGRNRTQESVSAKTVERGHSTPAMAGAFARRIGAERLVLNHIGARFPAADRHGPHAQIRRAWIREIERQAAVAWCPKSKVQPQAAWDFFCIALPPNRAPERADFSLDPASQMTMEMATAARGSDGYTEVDVEMRRSTTMWGIKHSHASGIHAGSSRGREAGPSSLTASASQDDGSQVRDYRAHGHHSKRKDAGSSSEGVPRPSSKEGGTGQSRRHREKKRREERGRPMGERNEHRRT